MITDTLHKRSIIRVLETDEPDREIFCIQNARSDATLLVYQMLKDADIKPGDEMTLDVKVLIERK
jgi:hypothetical protein